MNAQEPPALTICLLGTFDVRWHGAPVLNFESDKARALLAYLAVESRVPHRRAKLAGLLWPDWPPAQARAHLRHCLHNLRTIVPNADTMPPFLLADRHAIQFNPASRAYVDVAALETVADARPVDTTQPIDPAWSQQLRQAIASYAGPFMDGLFLEGCSFFEEWTLLTRERLQRELAGLLTQLAEIYAQQGALEEAVQTARRVVELDPLDEQRQRQLMYLLNLSGQRSAALAQYEGLRHLLSAELAVEPSPETIRLHQQIQSGQITRILVQSQRAADDRLESERQAPAKSNLPAALTSFVGRDRERRALQVLLDRADVRLVTVLGPAGVGKTRLALEVARHLAELPGNHVCFVSLAELDEPSLVMNTIAAQLEIRPRASQTMLETLKTTLSARPLLLLLDNFEHLLRAAIEVADLLTTIPKLKILATSREPLQLYGEHLFMVEPLSLPGDIGQSSGEAVQLFQERAQAVQPEFKVDQANLHTVAEICKVVDGLPLAVELASAQIRLLPVERLHAQLAEGFPARLDMLSSALQNVPDRQRTVRNTVAWSYHLLTAEEQRVFRHTALFLSAFDGSAAAAVCGGMAAHAVADCLAALAGKSLLKPVNGANRQPSFQMLVTLRAFGLEQLVKQQELEAAQLAYVHYYLNSVECFNRSSSHSEQYRAALAMVTAQYADIRAALLWTLTANQLELAMRFCAALPSYWSETSRYREADQWLRQVVQAAQCGPPTIDYAATLYTAGFSAVKLGDFTYARGCFERSLAAGVTLQNPTRIGHASALLALVCFEQGDYAASQTYYATCLQVRQQVDDWHIGLVLVNLGYAEACWGNPDQAVSLFEEGLALLEHVDEEYGLVVGWLYRTRIARMHGDMAAAQRYLEQAQVHSRQTPARHLQASIQVEAAFIQAAHGAHDLAQRTLQSGIATFDELGYLSEIVINAADVWTGVLAIGGQPETAVCVNAAATTSRERLGIMRAPLEQKWLAELIASYCQTLTDDEIAQAQHEGRLLGLNQLVQRLESSTS